MKSRLLAGILVGAFSIGLLSGCGDTASSGSGSDAASGVKILFTYSVESGNAFRDTLAESATVYAQSVGSTVDIALAGDSLEQQVSDIDQAKENGYDAIICIPEDAATARQLIAAADGLPIVFLNSAPDEDVLVENEYIYVGSDEGVAGSYQAQYALQTLNAKNAVVLKGQKGHSATIGRTKTLVDELTAGGCNIVFEDYADFDVETSEAVFDTFLRTGQDYDVVLCNNDAMAIGVINSLKKHGINPSSVPILGVDATEAGCEAIEKGQMCYTVYQSASGQGEYAARAAVSLGSGGTIDSIQYASDNSKYIWVPFEEVTSSNVSQYK